MLRSIDELSTAELDAVGPMPGESGFTALCVDATGEKSVQAVGAEAERALRRLAREQAVDDDEVLVALVLAGLVEIRADPGGWLTGSDAVGILAGRLPREGAGPAADLALSAFGHVNQLPIDDPWTLSARLYFFNRLPITRRWRDHWPNPDSVLAQFGLDHPNAFPGLTRIGGLDKAWIGWGRVGEAVPPRPFKLYLSPLPGDLGHVLQALRRLHEQPFHAIKIGADAGSLLRPDKCVLYFAEKGDLDATAVALQTELAGLAGQGVPFTSWIDTGGLLSWGRDPHPKTENIGRFSDASWRIWICNRLAVAMIAARHLEVGQAWSFALANLHFAGVDTEAWAPLEPAR